MRVRTRGRGSRPYSALVNERNHVTRLPLHSEKESDDPYDAAWAEGWKSNVIFTAVLVAVCICTVVLIVSLWVLHR